MPAVSFKMQLQLRKRYRDCPIDCPVYLDTLIESLGDFFYVFHSLLEPGKKFWFRGHACRSYRLAPSALRFSSRIKTETALGLVDDMKRYLEMKLSRPPKSDDRLAWLQVAQHYGVPTRLLDWTHNAAVALFFACTGPEDSDGLVVVLNPVELNQCVAPKAPRVFDQQRDAKIIQPYLTLGAGKNSRGRPTIAINPTWNTERIAMQQGAFTLHGSKSFDLDRYQASSLMYVPILKEHKPALLSELERVGIGEMFIFPEPEHVCKHLLRGAGLHST